MTSTIEQTALPASVLTKKQVKKFRAEYEDNGPCVIVAEVRHDDECGNGHNTFAITAEIFEKSYQPGEATAVHSSGRKLWLNCCGCCHEEIAKRIPELAPYIKWHLTSTDGPMHYIANTVYHALEHGPKSAWVYFEDKANGIEKQCMKYCDTEEAEKICKSADGYAMVIDPKTAKVRNLDHARSSAVWPDAADEDLTAPGLPERLAERLPGLMAEFKAAVESLGFVY